MSFVDLHCHWVHQIDDGARTIEESRAMLNGLWELGFGHVVATPHMRPGMFENSQRHIQDAFRRTCGLLHDDPAWPARGVPEVGLPEVSLGSEHFFDAQVLHAVHCGQGLPYRALTEPCETNARLGGAFLLEFLDLTPLPIIHAQLFELQTRGYVVVVAHPERYRATWGHPDVVEDLVNRGAVTLLDTAALVGKYGRRARDSALALLEEGLYHAACSDAHRPSDVDLVKQGMCYIEEHYGRTEVELLFSDNPRTLLAGGRPEL